ncbi:ATP-binding protein [Nodularia spumigena CS-584]|jgi:two-component system, chemotaxis family, CheB/CheR fusion protein|uniref:chemotaxis protein CheB n=1 Tax=Nodularia spumigena TaxID=70799 RepID=UPI0000EAB015|nr:chemotaxis protein CheB [Nodularia spumigena]AHJ29823.1 Chemotaxis protein methyltransferase CheR [Nodularia spumigena CCY9414]EAW46522.1 Signal Transduction Histidine Kinase (STHK) with CheB and CheR activity [Nodularia spumigena CCY9414]MDB9383552.1 ATP-binding protein [Nodularia spumigena CS-584]
MNSQSNSSHGKVSQNELFPVVGMGASAGGLEAFRELLSHLPIDTGMAFVLIQHLSPHQKSLLTEILARTTQMPVVEVEHGMVVEPNHVYVIPPNSMMTISQGILQLSPRKKTHGFSMTVDTFFISLAEERGNKAIGVVLSGGDSDGTKGLESIKAAGGITFAQCEESAKVNSMPNTAVASGYVDFILTPKQIAAELANISHHPYVNHPTPVKAIDTTPETGDALTNIFSLLRTATKVDFSHYKKTTLKRRIQRRMMLSKLDKLEDYVSYLQENPAQIKALYQDLLITVTSFFRDPEAFEALKTEIFPIITKNRTPNSPIRIWVAGCSTGEEAYSIAICLLEFLTNQGINLPIQIFASDINELAIEQARNGIYKENQVANISPERLQRFFVPVEGGYQISKPVRELCVFARQNLIGDPPFSRLDLITCRNVLIYLGSAVQKKLLPIFHYGLNSNGFLMLGTSETVGEFPDLFALVDRKNKIYSRKITATRLGMDLITNNYPLETVNTQPPVSADTWNDVELYKAADLIVLNDYAPVGVIINEDWEILQFRGNTSPYLQPPLGRPNFNLMKMAKDELRLELRTAIHQAKNREVPVSKSGIQMRDNEQVRQIKIDVVPFKPPAAREWYFLVLLASSSSSTAILEAVSPPGRTGRRKPNEQEQEIKRLKQELAANKEYLQSIIEEQQATNEDLRAANEEILSSNEELQSTNEELETAKEEIQATNEELNTINDELQRRNIQSNEVTNDLQNLLSSINIPILMLGGNLQIRRYTPVAEKIFNLISSDMGRPISDINHNLNIPDLEKQILDVIGTLNFKTQEVQDKNGRWYDLRIRPYRTIDNKIDGAVVILVDIDDLKRSSEQLRTSRDYVQAIVDTMRESLVVLDVNLRVISANEFFYDTFQVSPAETEQRLIYEMGNGQWNIPQLRSLLEEILPHHNQFQGLEVEHNFEQIGHKIMRLNARKMTLTDNREMILLVIEDITQQKQLEAERTHLLGQEQSARNAAEAANRAKDEFLSILSHELRNPLNSMLGWSKLLQKKQFDQATINKGLAAIERSAQAQAHLIKDLLDISRISAGRLRIDAQKLDLVSVIESAMEVVRFSAEAKNIQIESNLAPAPRSMVGDANRLQQVFWNLLSNAIKFTPSGGKVTISLDYTDFQAQIQISDTGYGISADFLPHVFERFRQADGSRTRSNPGLGLGLSIVRYLVELHGGTIDAESQGEGQGATFTVRLPLQAPQQQISLPISTEPATCINQPELSMDEIPSLEGVRVLVVDDQADICQLFKIVLEEYGAEMTGVESAKQAIATLKANPGGYDVLLSDIGLPEEDGYSLIRQVRKLSPEAGGQIPAAALTAYAEYADHTEALAAGFQMHLAKPIPPAQLLSIVATLAGRLK